MKLKITLKDPDGFYECVRDAAKNFADALPPNVAADEREAIAEKRQEKLFAGISKWVDYNEYVTIEFDTEAGTAVVVPK